MTSAMRAVAAASFAAGTATLSYLVGGVAGVCWAALASAAVLALVLHARWAAPRVATSPDPPEPVAGPGRFAGYEQLSIRLSAATQEFRYFDHAVRPRLHQLAVAIFAHRRGPGDPAELADRLGADVWSLLDPERPAWEDTLGERRPGPSVDQLRHVTDRIEKL